MSARRPVLPDLLAPGLRVVFCGTAAGAVSAARGAYYAGPGNRFWPMLFALGLTPRLFAPSEFPRLLEHGIGLTDLAKHVSGGDAALPRAAFDRAGLAARIRAAAPGVLAFNGRRAASEFLGVPAARLVPGPQPSVPDFPAVFVLPSTSGAARGHWDEAPWFALARALG